MSGGTAGAEGGGAGNDPGALLTPLLARSGGHPARALGLDPARDPDPKLAAWPWVCCLDGRGVASPRLSSSFEALAAADRLAPARLAAAEPLALAEALEAAGHPKAGRVAPLLVRAAAALERDHEGSVERLVAAADDLPALGGALVALAPGLGPATATRFLRPLRDRFAAAADLPLVAAARAAAEHLGLVPEGVDPEEALGALRATLAGLEGAPELPDLEAALEELGAAACLRGRPGRCPLGDRCPRRASA